jgi:NADH-quinone oxidoreductase subunit M
MLISLLVLIPLAGAALTYFLGKNSSSLAKGLSLGTSLVVAILAVLGTIQYYQGDITSLSVTKPWLTDLGISLAFKPDGIGLLLILLVAVLVPLILISTFRTAYEKRHVLNALVLLTQWSLIGLFSAGDIFLFYFFFEIALVPVYFLALWWGGESAPKVTFRMFVFTIFGSLFMLAALIFLYTKGQTGDIVSLTETAKLMPLSIQRALFWGLFLAFAIKMPVFPFHSWQPEVYAESPTPATMLLSGLLSKMGVFGLLKIALPLAPAGVKEYAIIASVLAVAGLLYGSFIAIKQDSIKRVIAYSSFAHMGLMAAGVLSGTFEGIQGAVYQMLAHGINAVGLFYVAKLIFEKTGSRSLSALGGISQSAKGLSITFMIILLGSVALPLTNGFVGEFLMLKGVFDFNGTLGVLAGLSIIFGAVYMLRLFQKTMFGPVQNTTVDVEDLQGTEKAVLYIISALVIIMGIFPNVLLKISEPAVKQLVEYLGSIN